MNKYYKINPEYFKKCHEINLQTFAESENIENNVSRETLFEENKDNENNVSRETFEKNEIDYSEKFDKINEGLKNINAQLKMLNNEEEEVESNEIFLFDNGIEKYLTDNKNKKLSDYDVYKKVLNQIGSDINENKDINIPYKFVEYMKRYVDNHEKGVLSDASFKKTHIEMKYPIDDYFKNKKIKIKKD